MVRNAKKINQLNLGVIIVDGDGVWNYEDITNTPIKFWCGLKVKKYLLCYRYKKVKYRWNFLEYIKSGL